MSNSLWPHGLYSPWNSPSQNPGVGSLSLLQGIFPTQGWNPGLPHCGQILYQLSHKGSPGIVEWVTYPFSSGPSWSRNQTGHILLKLYSNYIPSNEMEETITKNTLPSKTLVQSWWRNQKLCRQPKLIEFGTTKPALQEILEEFF